LFSFFSFLPPNFLGIYVIAPIPGAPFFSPLPDIHHAAIATVAPQKGTAYMAPLLIPNSFVRSSSLRLRPHLYT